MKRYFFLLLTLFVVSFSVQATDYFVFKVTGEVRCSNGSKRVLLQKRDKLTEKSIVTIPAGGKLEILDVDGKSKIVIKTAGTRSIQQFLKMESTTQREAKPKYWSLLLKQLVKDDSEDPAIGDHHGVIDRDLPLNDSICKKKEKK